MSGNKITETTEKKLTAPPAITGTALLTVILADEIYQRQIKNSIIWRVGSRIAFRKCRLLKKIL